MRHVRASFQNYLKNYQAALAAVFVFALASTVSMSQAFATLSAARNASTPGSHYLRAAQSLSILNGNLSQSGTALWEKGPLKDAKLDRVPELSAGDLQASFELVRDDKPFTDDQQRRRRATWLYPDDGCFVRASVAADVIAKSTSVKTAKIFAFDSLSVKTDNSPEGHVEWWYHVAAIAKVVDAKTGKEDFYVYDPAIQARTPMELHAWLTAMNAPNADVAICSGDAYDPDSDCTNGIPNVYDRAKGEATSYLWSEWSRIEDLGRDPKRELGDFPPWL